MEPKVNAAMVAHYSAADHIEFQLTRFEFNDYQLVYS
jgi:hypothetical protein